MLNNGFDLSCREGSIFGKHYKNIANNSTATTTLNRKQSVQVSDTTEVQ
jgi:hypothetical protein